MSEGPERADDGAKTSININVIKRLFTERIGSDKFNQVREEERAKLNTDKEREAFDKAVQQEVGMVTEGVKGAVERYIKGDPSSGSPPHDPDSIRKK